MFFGKGKLLFFLLETSNKNHNPSTLQQSSWKGWSKVWNKKLVITWEELPNLNTHMKLCLFQKGISWMDVYWSFSLSLFGRRKKNVMLPMFLFIFFLWGSESFSRETYTRPFVEILTTSNSSTECTIAGAAPRARRPLAIKSILTSAHQLHIGTTQLCNKKNQLRRQGT